MDSKTKREKPLPARRLRELAVEAEADPRTVERVLLGKSPSSGARDRIERVLRKAGIAFPAVSS